MTCLTVRFYYTVCTVKRIFAANYKPGYRSAIGAGRKVRTAQSNAPPNGWGLVQTGNSKCHRK